MSKSIGVGVVSLWKLFMSHVRDMTAVLCVYRVPHWVKCGACDLVRVSQLCCFCCLVTSRGMLARNMLIIVDKEFCNLRYYCNCVVSLIRIISLITTFTCSIPLNFVF